MISIVRRIPVLSTILVSCCVRAVFAEPLPLYRQNPITSGVAAPTAVAVDERGNVYVTESSRNRMLVYDQSGELIKVLKGLDKPTGIAVGRNGRVYICNTGRSAVDVYRGNLSHMFSVDPGEGLLKYPTSVVLDRRGNIFVVDSKDHRVKVYDKRGRFNFSFGGHGNEEGKFNFPVSIAIDEAAGEIVVSDLRETAESSRGARIQVFSKDGTFRRCFGRFGRGEGLFVRPMGVAVDGSGRIYVADAFQNIVQVFDSNGVFIDAIHDPAHPLRTPLGIAYSPERNLLLVTSLNTSRVEIFGADNVEAGGP